RPPKPMLALGRFSAHIPSICRGAPKLLAPQNRDFPMASIDARPPKARSLLSGLLAFGLAMTGLAGCAQNGVIYNQQKYLSGTKLYVTHVAGSNLPTV